MFENNATTTFNNLKNNLNMEISLDKINTFIIEGIYTLFRCMYRYPQKINNKIYL